MNAIKGFGRGDTLMLTEPPPHFPAEVSRPVEVELTNADSASARPVWVSVRRVIFRLSSWVPLAVAASVAAGCGDDAGGGSGETGGTDTSSTSASTTIPGSSSTAPSTSTSTSTTADATDSSTTFDDMSTGTSDTTQGSSDTGTGGSSSGSDSGSTTTGDNEAPSVVMVAPDTGATGVLADVEVVVTFSEAMDTTATEAAYASTSLAAVSFAWSVGDTELTITPDEALVYATGLATDDPAALEYDFTLGVEATDVAGNALESPFDTNFFTARRLTMPFAPDGALTDSMNSDGGLLGLAERRSGDDFADRQVKAFMSFDISGLPDDIINIEAATLTAMQLISNNGLFLAAAPARCNHITTDQLDLAAFSVAELAYLGNLTEDEDAGPRELDVLAGVNDDYNNDRTHAQYRVEHNEISNGDGLDTIARFDSEQLTVEYVAP